MALVIDDKMQEILGRMVDSIITRIALINSDLADDIDGRKLEVHIVNAVIGKNGQLIARVNLGGDMIFARAFSVRLTLKEGESYRVAVAHPRGKPSKDTFFVPLDLADQDLIEEAADAGFGNIQRIEDGQGWDSWPHSEKIFLTFEEPEGRKPVTYHLGKPVFLTPDVKKPPMEVPCEFRIKERLGAFYARWTGRTEEEVKEEASRPEPILLTRTPLRIRRRRSLSPPPTTDPPTEPNAAADSESAGDAGADASADENTDIETDGTDGNIEAEPGSDTEANLESSVES